jgi:hypothetical protein
MFTLPKFETKADYEAWLDEIVPLPEGATLRRVSVDTLKRAHKDGLLGEEGIITLSKSRRGVRRRTALGLPWVAHKIASGS